MRAEENSAATDGVGAVSASETSEELSSVVARSVADPVLSVAHSMWPVADPAWSVAYPVRSIAHPVWSVAHPAWSVVHPVWSVAHPVWSVALGARSDYTIGQARDAAEQMTSPQFLWLVPQLLPQADGAGSTLETSEDMPSVVGRLGG